MNSTNSGTVSLKTANRILGCRSPEDIPMHILAPISSMVGASSGIAINFDRVGDALHVRGAYLYRISRESLDAYMAHYAKIDPLVQGICRGGLPRGRFPVTAAFSGRARGGDRAAKFYQEFMRPIGLDHILGLLIKSPLDDRHWVGIGLHRSEGSAPFTSDDRHNIESVAPMLSNSWGLTFARMQLDASFDMLETVRQNLALPGVLGLDQNFDIVQSCGWVDVGPLPQIKTACAAVRAYAQQPDMAERLQRGDTLALNFAGMPSRLNRVKGSGRGVTYILMAEAGAEPHAADLQGRAIQFGLSPRERQVVDLVKAGASNAAIAAKLGVSTRTVDHHLGAIYRKLSVRSRTQMLARLSKIH